MNLGSSFIFLNTLQDCSSFNLICCSERLIAKMLPCKNRWTQSTSLGSRYSWIPPPPPPTIPHVYTGPGSLLGGHACVCVSLLTSAERLHDLGLPAGIYWLALCPAAGRLVRSVLTTSAPQRHLWTINWDTEAVWTTAEPTQAANWCFTMPPCKRKLLKHHWQWRLSMPFTDGVICRAPKGESESATTRISKSQTVKGRWIPRDMTHYQCKNTLHHIKSRRPSWKSYLC